MARTIVSRRKSRDYANQKYAKTRDVHERGSRKRDVKILVRDDKCVGEIVGCCQRSER